MAVVYRDLNDFLFPGVKFTWTKAQYQSNPAAFDGSVVENSPVVAGHPNVLTFQGIDPSVSPGPNVNVMPLYSLGGGTPALPDHFWLRYDAGITYKTKFPGTILTGPMSGCLLTAWQQGADSWVGHVGTGNEVSLAVNRNVKKTFNNTVMATNPGVKGFNPAYFQDNEMGNSGKSRFDSTALMNQFVKDPVAGWAVWGMITPAPARDFYALLILTYKMGIQPSGAPRYVVAAKQKVPPMNRDELRMAYKMVVNSSTQMALTMDGTAAMQFDELSGAHFEQLGGTIMAFGGIEHLTQLLGEYEVLNRSTASRGLCPCRGRSGAQQRKQQLDHAFMPYGGAGKLGSNLAEYQYMRAKLLE